MPLELHDVQDAEAFCWRAVEDARLTLSWHEREDLHGFLLVAVWQLSLKYDPERKRVSFATFAGYGLRHAVVNWKRERYGRRTWKFKNRVYERKLPELVPLDDRLGDSEPALAGDDEADSDPALRGLFEDRDRFRDRDIALLRRSPFG